LVDTGDEQGGGTTGAEAVGLDLVGRDVGDVLDSGGGSSQGMGDFGGGDGAGSGVVVVVGVQWSCRGGSMFAKVEDASLASTDRAEDRVPGEAVAECFPTGGVLLVSVSEGDVYPSSHVIRGTLRGGSALDVSMAEGGVAEAERLAASTVGGGREGVLARAAEEEKAKDAEVHDGFGSP
jgi:hypothetical protein